jgi:hypothetical protein
MTAHGDSPTLGSDRLLTSDRTFKADTMTTTPFRHARLLVAAGTVALTALLGAAGLVAATGPATVGLGTAAPFAVLAGTPKVASTGATVINGNVGISPAAAVTGFPPGIVHGTTHKADAVALQAQSDLTIAYTDAAGRPVTATHGTLGGLTLAPGVYNAGGVVLDLTGTLTLNGHNDPNAVWIFQATSALVTASSSKVKLINGANSCNVFWQVTSSATLGSGSTFVGTIMALTSITLNSGVTLHGRALARNGQVSLIKDTITSSTCFKSGGGGLPATDTLPSSVPSGSGPSPLFFIGFFLAALVIVNRMRAGAARAR